MGYASKSPWVIHYDGSSCNGCDIEVLATLCPGFDGERFGVVNTGNPKHADIFLVTGSVNEQNIAVVKEIYDQMVEPKVVVACGICACTGGVFHDCYNVIGGVDKAIPVDVYAPGCAVRPESLIDAIVEGVNICKKATKPNAQNPQGGIVEKEAPIHVSNLMVLDPKSGQPTKVGRKANAEGKLVRYAKKSGEEIK